VFSFADEFDASQKAAIGPSITCATVALAPAPRPQGLWAATAADSQSRCMQHPDSLISMPSLGDMDFDAGILTTIRPYQDDQSLTAGSRNTK
jgi:hypothetical protein